MEKREEYLGLHNLVAPAYARRPQKRVGRGESSGHGRTCGRGNKGQKARKSGNVRIGFEGGQNPLARRLPKRGFTSRHAGLSIVNLSHLSNFFDENAKIDPAALVAAGLLRSVSSKIKVLGVGEPKKGFALRIHGISDSARAKVEKSGGSVEILD